MTHNIKVTPLKLAHHIIHRYNYFDLTTALVLVLVSAPAHRGSSRLPTGPSTALAVPLRLYSIYRPLPAIASVFKRILLRGRWFVNQRQYQNVIYR